MRAKILQIWNKPYLWFESFVKPGEDLGVRGLYRIFVFALLVVLSLFIIDIGLTAYAYKANEPNHGVFGDFFGGVANPFLTFLTFMGLLLTIVVQKVELRDSREEMKRSADALSEQVDAFRKQSFEVTFLKMLEIHSVLTQSIDLVLVKAQKTVTGSDCMERFHSRLKTKYRGKFKDRGKEICTASLEDMDELRAMYADFWEPTRKNLHSWHESLSVILGYIQSESNSIEPYLSMVSAQLSEYEKILVFYHIALHGDSRLRILVLELGFLRNLPVDLLLHRSHMQLVPTSSFL
jgi:hypothetical protein